MNKPKMMYFSVLLSAILGFFLLVLPDNLNIKEEPNEVPQSTQQINQKEFKCLSDAIYYEAGNQGLQGMKAVADVIQNRTLSKSFKSKTYCGIIHEKHQFSFLLEDQYRNPELKTQAESTNEHKVAQMIALDVLTGEHQPVLEGDVLWYHADYVHPKWSKFMQKVKTIKQHVFYREGDNQ